MVSLKEVFCQDRAIDTLQKAYACDRVAHAYIFAGAEGVGKYETAAEWAKLLLCSEPVVADGFADSCGRCESCTRFDAGAHPDYAHVYKELREFTKDGKGKAAPVEMPKDVVVEFLIDKISARPALSQRRVFVLSEAEKLNDSSQNALLKSLEEPPEFCCIILLCTRLEKLLPTTKSRCQTIRFGPVDEARIAGRLAELGITGPRCGFLARFSGGSIGRACDWAELEKAEAGIYESKTELLTSLGRLAYADSLEIAARWLAMAKQISTAWAQLESNVSKSDINRRCLKIIVDMAISAFSDAMKLGLGQAEGLINADQPSVLQALAGRYDPEQCAEMIAECYQAVRWIEASVNDKLIFEQLLLKFAGAAIISV